MSADEAFVTLATSNGYCTGALVVAMSLRRHGTTRRIAVMVTTNVSEESRAALEDIFDEVIVVDGMDSEDHLHLSWLGRPELGITFTKIHCWTLTQYRKCVFLDADTLVLSNVDELFERDELSAAPDPGWPDCFNSGVFVFRPSHQTHARLLEHALQHGSFDGGDQGLLNSFFSGWAVEDIRKHLPFIYNLCATSVYSYRPAFQQFGHNAKIVHFLGAEKPWSQQQATGHSHSMGDFVSLWWKEYLSHTSSPPAVSQTSQHHHVTQIQEPEVKMPETEKNLHSSNSLLTHYPPLPCERLPASAEPQTSSPTDVQIADPPLEDEAGPPETRDIKDSGLGAEGSEASDTDAQSPVPASPVTQQAPRQPSPQMPVETELPEQRRLWEEGHVDYMGKDAFHNIQKMLDRFLD
ncbi:glycogenin-2 [Aulostomus maculatus]